MGLIVTPARRRLAMVAMLLLAVAGGIIRHSAPDPSTLRDVGSLLLVLWLPAVGNLIGYLLRKIPRKPPPVTDFPPGSPFAPQLRVQVQADALPAPLAQALDPQARLCTVLVGRQGFTARLAQPLVQTFATGGAQELALELLHPALALARLPAGTDLYLLVGTTGVAKGRVLAAKA